MAGMAPSKQGRMASSVCGFMAVHREGRLLPGPGVWLNACSGAKSHGQQVVQLVRQHGGSSPANANALEFMFHGQPVPLEHRQVRRRRGSNVRAARLDLTVRCDAGSLNTTASWPVAATSCSTWRACCRER